MNTRDSLKVGAPALLVLAGCLANPMTKRVVPAPQSTPTAVTVQPEGRTLYARDGSVVAVEPPAPTRITGTPVRELGGQEGSRVFLLELYQKAMDEKEGLTLRVQGLEAELDRETRGGAELSKQRLEMQAAVESLTRERDLARAETMELAQRLTTAQIRRLEAEKALLEFQIEARRPQEAAARAVNEVTRSEPKGGNKP